MPRRNNRLIFLAITLISLTLYWSCSQPGDVILEKSTTVVSLTSERLPSPPEGMIYELWVCKNETVDTSVATSDVKSMGRFSFDNDVKKYYDENGVEIENRFVLDDDIFNYSKIFVSVELIDDPEPNRPGPIMLLDDVTLPDENPMYLVFPLSDSLHRATAAYNKETVSDRSPSNVGRGIWFCNYETGRDSITDTNGIANIYFDTIDAEETDLIINCVEDEFGEPVCDTSVAKMPWDTISTEIQVVDVDYGADTIAYVDNITHTRVDIVYDSFSDTEAPYQKVNIRLYVNTTSFGVNLHIFNQFDFNLPDYSSLGWKYKGWIVSKAIPNTAIGDFTPPAWPYHTNNYNYLPGYTGGLLTTGTFSEIAAADDANPFTIAGVKVPPYPGEDFLNSEALLDSLGLVTMPNLNSDSGTVFLSLEPMNFITDTTNFPLYVMVKAIDPASNNEGMFNRTGTIKGDLFWFPEVTVSIIERY